MRRIVFATLVLGASAASAHAQVITSLPGLPPGPLDINGNPIGYVTAAQVHASYSGPGLTAILSQVQHRAFSNIMVTNTGGNETETFQSVLSGLVSINGGPNTPFLLTGPVQVEVFGRATPTSLGTFSTQMLSMDMTGNVAGHTAEVKLDPTTATTGQTTVDNNPGGGFRINSFFDVFTEISLDSGQFIAQNNGPTHVTAVILPEPSSFALLGMMGAFGAASYAWRRRRAARV